MDEFRKELLTKEASEKADSVNLLAMLESRIQEVIKIEQECKRKQPKLFRQRCPRFMRRRAASHNINRVPRRFRIGTDPKAPEKKNLKRLLKKRRRLQFRKHKRILSRYARYKYKDTDKCVLHKWFAKRFKMGTVGNLNGVPIRNNTKNKRNLIRQAKYGCAYLSYAHLIALSISLAGPNDENGRKFRNQLNQLNRLSNVVSGFTFLARSLEGNRYEVVIHLYKPDSQEESDRICPSFVSIKVPKSVDKLEKPPSILTMWIPRNHQDEVLKNLELISAECVKPFQVKVIPPQEWTRLRLIGPKARQESIRIAKEAKVHTAAGEEATMRLHKSLVDRIGRFVEDDDANFTYYATSPLTVDIVFKKKLGRMLWYKLIKTRAHLVGGYEDVTEIFKAPFNPTPFVGLSVIKP